MPDITSWYRDGTATVAQGSPQVVGAGTYWQTQCKPGDAFGLLASGGIVKWYEILEIQDNTHLELRDNFAEASVSGAAYAIMRNFTGAWSMTGNLAADFASHVREFKLLLQRNLKGDQGEKGADGNTIHSGTGAPVVTLGAENDWYLNITTWDIYRKESGTWILRGNLQGTKGDPGVNGSIWYWAATDPVSAAGSPNDYHLNTTSGDVYRRDAGGWVKAGNLRGPQGLQGPQGPQGATGPKGDTGTPGARWHSGSGAPVAALGADGDWYVNIAAATGNGDIYQRAAGAWSLKGNMRGPQGERGQQGIPGINWRGAYAPATAYAPGDGVTNGGSSYLCLTACTGAAPPEGGDANWLVLARKGVDGQGAGDMQKADYDPDGDGKVTSAAHADTATTATSANSAARAAAADAADAVPWEGVSGRPTAYPPQPHGMGTHDAFSLAELNSKISDTDLTPLPAIGASDGLKVLRAKEDRTGYELAEMKAATEYQGGSEWGEF